VFALGALALAAALVPPHVQSWYYYGLNGVNNAVPPAMMARYADFAEDDGHAAEHAMAFKRAGGRYAISYTDPAYVPYCHPPFAPPAGHCEGPIGDLITSEDAWFHGADGTRVRHYGSPASTRRGSRSRTPARSSPTGSAISASHGGR
jgi:hypothetical protein